MWKDSQLRSEVSGWCTLLALAGVTSPVASLAVTTSTATTATERLALTLAITSHHATRGSVRTLLLDVRSGHDLSRQVEPLAEVVETLGGEGVVVVLPRELGLDISARGQGLASLDHVEVLRVNVVVLGKVEVLLGDEHALAEEVLVDLLAVGLGDEPAKVRILVYKQLKPEGKVGLSSYILAVLCGERDTLQECCWSM